MSDSDSSSEEEEEEHFTFDVLSAGPSPGEELQPEYERACGCSHTHSEHMLCVPAVKSAM